MNRVLLFPVLVFFILTACSGPDEKKTRFYKKAKIFMEKGDVVKAGLELKNAIQIDPKYADAHYLLGLVELRTGKYQQAFGNFKKAVELAPGNLDAQVELGKLFLMQGDTGKAQAQEKADLVLKAQPAHADGLLLRGAILLSGKEWYRGAELLEGVIAGGVTKPDAYLMLALARNALKNTKAAEAALLEGAGKNPSSLGIQKALADLYAAGGRVNDAAARIRRMIELEPASYSYGITLAGLYWNSGRIADARDVLGKLASTNQKNEECLTALAGFYLSRRQTDEAEKVLKEGIQAIPKTFRLRFALSEIYSGTGRSEQAVVLLKESLGLEKDQKKPEVIQAKNLLARICFMRGEIPEAERYLAEIMKVSSGHIDATYLTGRIHLLKREGVAAISAFRTIINDRPKDAEAYLLLADAHQINKEPNLVMENLQQAERLEPDSLRVARAFARNFFAQKEFKKGEERMERYLTKHPGDAEARIELGDQYRLSGDLRRAEAEYRSVKRHAPEATVPYLRLSELFVQQGNLPRAIAEMEILVRKLPPNNIQTALLLASLHLRAADPPKARHIYDELLATYPKEWHVVNDYACFLADYGNSPADLELAYALAKDVAAQRPDDPNILDTLGWAEYRRGNYAKAVELLEKANIKLTGHQTVSYHLGMASFQTGKKEQARTCLNKALAGADFPGKREAGETLKRL